MDNIPQSWQSSFQLGWTYTIAQFSTALPRIVGAFAVFVIGLLIARVLRNIVIRTLEAIRVSNMVEKTPLEHFLKNSEAGQKLEEIIGSIVYWLFLFVVLHTSVALLGLTPLSDFMNRILGYIPHIFSALLIFVFGVLFAGVAEGVVKGGLRSIDIHSARLLAKVASYTVMSIAVLAAIAELGIASEFIIIFFFGVVSAFALGAGLAIGLGGQHLVRRIMDEWYDRKTN